MRQPVCRPIGKCRTVSRHVVVRKTVGGQITVTYEADSRVGDYINALPDWQRAICQEVRDLVHAADPGVVETAKFNGRPYFVLDGNIGALQATRDHVNVFLFDYKALA